MHHNIAFLNNSQGEHLEELEDIEKELLGYYQNILQEPAGNRRQEINKVSDDIPRLITDDHNSMLVKPVSLQEVEQATTQLKDGKASGLDIFTTNLFHFF